MFTHIFGPLTSQHCFGTSVRIIRTCNINTNASYAQIHTNSWCAKCNCNITHDGHLIAMTARVNLRYVGLPHITIHITSDDSLLLWTFFIYCIFVVIVHLWFRQKFCQFSWVFNYFLYHNYFIHLSHTWF